MNTKQLLYFAAIFLGVTGFGQTKVIFHKSHSGKMSDFQPTDPGNFGLVDPQLMIHLIEKINDSTVVFYRSNNQKAVDTIQYETLSIGEKINLDSLKKAYPNASFVGFDVSNKEQIETSFFRQDNEENNWLPLLLIFIGLTGGLYGRWLYQEQFVSGA